MRRRYTLAGSTAPSMQRSPRQEKSCGQQRGQAEASADAEFPTAIVVHLHECRARLSRRHPHHSERIAIYTRGLPVDNGMPPRVIRGLNRNDLAAGGESTNADAIAAYPLEPGLWQASFECGVVRAEVQRAAYECGLRHDVCERQRPLRYSIDRHSLLTPQFREQTPESAAVHSRYSHGCDAIGL